MPSLNSPTFIITILVIFHVSLTTQRYITYQRFREILISRSQAGDHWEEMSRANCVRYRKAVYSAEDMTCRCPQDAPNFFSNGDDTGCYAGHQIDPSKFKL